MSDDLCIPGIDLPRLRGYLSPIIGCDPSEINAEMINGGRSNLTYRLAAQGRQYVLRRAPLGHVLVTAHDVKREFRVMKALHSTGFPVPSMIHFAEDPSVIGAPFAVSEFVDGPVIRDAEQAASLTARQARAVGLDLVDRLAQLHGIDPEPIGLGSFGRPAGFMRRQIRRWLTQWEQSSPDETVAMRRLAESLSSRIPPDPPPTIVHGDYRLDNTILDVDDPAHIAAIVDWEMSSLGDPMTDIAMLATYWSPVSAKVTGTVHSISGNDAFPSISELVDRYLSARRLPSPDLAFYIAFGHYKLAGIAATIDARYRQGKTVGAQFQTAGQAIPQLVDEGLEALTHAGFIN